MTDYSDIHIETTLPKPWEEETTFNDILYDWMSRAPWMVISLAAHLLAYFILASIPWRAFLGGEEKIIEASLQQTPEEEFEEPEEEIEEEVEEEEPEEPVLQDSEVETTEDIETETDTDFLSDSPFDSDAFNDVIGIGGGAGGKFGGRMGKGKGKYKRAGSAVEQALKDALEWLKHHQSEEGYWGGESFPNECGKIGSNVCDGAGHATHDVGLTGLCLLAFMGDGNTTNQGEYQEVVRRGIGWLKDQQGESGLLGEETTHDFIYDHSLATLAITEAYYFSKSPLIKRTAQKAIDYIQRARNPYTAWRYDVPPLGDNDTSITGWMIFALASAKDAKLKVDPAALEGAMSWIDEASDPTTGRVGYDSFGSQSSRTPVNEHFPREKGEAMTAVGLLCRIFMGQNPKDDDILIKHADLLMRVLPEWDPDGFGCDMYYWYYGTYAMFQLGGKHWKSWEQAMRPAILDNQRHDGDEKGSWDAAGPWGYVGGRVYSTALMTLCIEVYFRYAQVLGAR